MFHAAYVLKHFGKKLFHHYAFHRSNEILSYYAIFLLPIYLVFIRLSFSVTLRKLREIMFEVSTISTRATSSVNVSCP